MAAARWVDAPFANHRTANCIDILKMRTTRISSRLGAV
jgi:hypothetical protein